MPDDNDEFRELLNLRDELAKILHPPDVYSASIDDPEKAWTAISETVKTLLFQILHVNSKDDNFVGTPYRVASAMVNELFYGLRDAAADDLTTILSTGFKNTAYDEMIVYTDIHSWSFCPHHLLPVEYVWAVGYIPKDRVLGASKFSRAIQLLSRRPVLQEQLTQDIHQAFSYALGMAECHASQDARDSRSGGVAIVGKGGHMCMKMRGVEEHESMMTTSALSGPFKDKPEVRAEFFSLTKK